MVKDVALIGSGITGYSPDSIIQVCYMTKGMGLAFVVFTWWCWVGEVYVIFKGPV